MRYSFEFKKDKFGDLEILLPEKISIFSDFIQNISTVEELDEYIGYIQNVIDGVYENFEITLNATSVNIKKDETVAEHHYRIEEPFENKIETKEFIELLLIWREEIPDILQKDFILENGTEFEEHLEYGGPYELAIVEYTPDGNEKLFTGLAYDKYENGNIESYFYVEQGVKQGKCVEFYSNGNVKKIGNRNKSAADGYQVEFFENGNKKYESEYIAGREMTYIKYDENGSIVEKKTEPDESDLKYVEKFNG